MGTRRPEEGYREMLLLELVESYWPIYPEGAEWRETAELLYAEEPEHMAHLTASLAAGGWREPIVLSLPDDLEEGDPPMVLNGTHRVAIALKEGVISVPVATRHELPELEDAPFTELEVELTAGEELSSDDEQDRIFSLLRSFELNGDIWLNSDICSGSDSNWRFYYMELQDGVHHELLKRRARAMLKGAFPDRRFRLTAKLDEFDEDEDEG